MIRSSRWDVSLLKQPCRTQASSARTQRPCQAAARWRSRSQSRESKQLRKAAGKQVQADPHTKRHRKAKRTSPPNTHTHTPLNPAQPAGWGGRDRGRKLSPGSWHSSWPPASSAAPAAHAASPAGGCSPRPLSVSSAGRQPQQQGSSASPAAEKGSWGCSPSCAPLCFACFESCFCTGLHSLPCCESRAFNPENPNIVSLGRKAI